MAGSWIPLLVPEDDYLELAALVAERVSQLDEAGDLDELNVRLGTVSSAPEVDTATAALERYQPWAVAELRRLATSEAVTAQRWVRAMDVCAAHIGEFLSTQQVVAESGMSLNEWRDAPRKMTRHLASNYPTVNGNWPLVVVSGKSLGHAYDQAYWAITEEQASRWFAAREAAK